MDLEIFYSLFEIYKRVPAVADMKYPLAVTEPSVENTNDSSLPLL